MAASSAGELCASESQETVEKLKGDLFDSILFLEDEAVKKGRAEGQAEAIKRGRIEGRQLGIKKGHEVGAEVGFYLGFAKTWLELQDDDIQSKKKEVTRARKQLQQLASLAESFPKTNPKDADLAGQIEAMRAKFKHSCALLKIECDFTTAASTGISW